MYFLLVFCVLLCGVQACECWVRANKAFKVFPTNARSQVCSKSILMYTLPEGERNFFEFSDSIQEDELLQLFKEQLPLLQNRDPQITKGETHSSLKTQHLRKEMIQRAVPLTALAPLEFIHNGNIHFGNIISGSDEISSITVRVSSGNEVKIDKAQIISVWEELNDESPPVSPTDWADVTVEAMIILRQLSSRKLQLDEFWKAVQRTQGVNGRDSSYGIDSQDLSIFTFQESKFPAWIDPNSPTVSSVSSSDWQLVIGAPSAAQRMAMALLLFHDNVHFKRRVSVHAWPEETTISSLTHTDDMGLDVGMDEIDTDISLGRQRKATNKELGKRKNKLKNVILAQSYSQKNQQALIYVKEGGYRLVDEATVRSKETDLFLHYYQVQLKKSFKNTTLENTSELKTKSTPSSQDKPTTSFDSPVHTVIIRRYLRDLELYVMTSLLKQDMPPPKHLSTLLKRCSLSCSHTGARQLLMEIGRDVSQTYNPTICLKTNSGNITTEVTNELNHTQIQRIINITPWSNEVLEAASQLVQDITSRRITVLTHTPLPVTSGKKNSRGFFDYRGSMYPPICIDSPSSAFSDDAFQIHPETGEVLIHVTDIPLNPTSSSTKYAPLVAVCQERILSCYLPSGPVHMMPSSALHALSLSSKSPNEVITVAVKLDMSTGRVLQTRVFPSWIGPVEKVTIPQVDRILSVATSLMADRRRVVGVSQKVLESLHTMNNLVKKLLIQDPYWNDNFASNEAREKGELDEEEENDAGNGAFRILNTFLSMYAHVTYGSLSGIQTNTSSVSDIIQLSTTPTHRTISNHEKSTSKSGTHLPAPVAWEHWDRQHGQLHQTQSQQGTISGRIRRFATQPLRSYVSLLQQRQVKAALRLETGVTRSACVAAVRLHNAKRRQLAQLLSPHSKL